MPTLPNELWFYIISFNKYKKQYQNVINDINNIYDKKIKHVEWTTRCSIFAGGGVEPLYPYVFQAIEWLKLNHYKKTAFFGSFQYYENDGMITGDTEDCLHPFNQMIDNLVFLDDIEDTIFPKNDIFVKMYPELINWKIQEFHTRIL